MKAQQGMSLGFEGLVANRNSEPYHLQQSGQDFGDFAVMNRTRLQQLTKEKIADAQALLNAGRWSAAYYLIGYAVECALKSCLLRYIEETGFIFVDRVYAKNLHECWTHNYSALLKKNLPLEIAVGKETSTNLQFKANWERAQEWQEESRYEDFTEQEARNLFEAITQQPDGVLPWLLKYS